MPDAPDTTNPTTPGIGWPALMRADMVARYLDWSVSYLRRRVRARQFPRPSINEARADGRKAVVRWQREHIDLWIKAGYPSEDAFAAMLEQSQRPQQERRRA